MRIKKELQDYIDYNINALLNSKRDFKAIYEIMFRDGVYFPAGTYHRFNVGDMAKRNENRNAHNFCNSAYKRRNGYSCSHNAADEYFRCRYTNALDDWHDNVINDSAVLFSLPGRDV